ncbi:hypothetical protein [Caulobacter sp.]|uniref:hypothetical protein n=1 Tax=Caulobacter sp. TaxID=78 RepID=UPI001B0E1F12|nr:hypothetical protein [Caulobacter sp.]MBO9543658.1 hypothetical protein [Caulobacter sp.]
MSGPATRTRAHRAAAAATCFRDGRRWRTFFGNDDQTPFREKPGLIAIAFDKAGRVVASRDQPFKPFA